MEQFAKETLPVSLEAEMRHSYLDYAMSVIVGRALPDARDGLKPVHRRVLFAMHEANIVWNRPYVKCARVVGDVMGKYHPHGDLSIYDALVRMAQDFSLRYQLIDGQGNFGSVDGDNAGGDALHRVPAAEDRRRAARRHRQGNGRLRPELRRQGAGAGGAAVAAAEPPRQRLVGHRRRHGDQHPAAQPDRGRPTRASRCSPTRNSPIDELIDIVPAPDFPTAGIIYGLEGVHEGYRTGRGRVVMRARTHVEDLDKGNRQAIIVDEIPYQVNKANLLIRIGELVARKEARRASPTCATSRTSPACAW